MCKLSLNVVTNVYNSLQSSFLSLAWPWSGRSLPKGNQWEWWDPGLGPNVVGLPVHLPFPNAPLMPSTPLLTPNTPWCPYTPANSSMPQHPYTPCWPVMPSKHPTLPASPQCPLHPLPAPDTPTPLLSPLPSDTLTPLLALDTLIPTPSAIVQCTPYAPTPYQPPQKPKTQKAVLTCRDNWPPQRTSTY